MNRQSLRMAALVAATFVILGLFTGLLVHYQLRVGPDEEVLAALTTQSVRQTTSAARGTITDRNGSVLVCDRVCRRVELDNGSPPTLGRVVRELLRLCRRTGDVVTEAELPVTKTAPYEFTNNAVYSVTDTDGTAAPTRLGRLCRAMGWEQTPDAGALLAQMAETFGLSPTEDRQALGVLYSWCLRQQGILATDYAVVEDASLELVTLVEEQGLAGVTVTLSTCRNYVASHAPHLLGRVGAITQENWSSGENYRSRGYQMDDRVGVSGAEHAFESLLRGTEGVTEFTLDREGDLLEERVLVPAQKGADVALTLDLALQRCAEETLARYVPALNQGAGGGAAVVVDVTDGGILACASYPTFDLATMTYEPQWAELSPLFNRCLQGTYSPGSTYKMVTAAAALETGAITSATPIPCTGSLDYYGTPFRCWIYRERGTTHSQTETVTAALADSCNIFFYTLGMEVGIDTLTDYARDFGLGVETGVELGEALGVNAGPDYSERIGAPWYGGNLLSAAIGQSDNRFTPLQLANYIATLVNGGHRRQVHLLRAVTYPDGTLEEFSPRILGEVALEPAHLEAIKAGMAAVADKTAAFDRLRDYGITLGAKTGSAQVTGQEHANGLFVCFAPYDDPQVAVCVAVEKGGSGASTAIIAAKILETYFGLPDGG